MKLKKVFSVLLAVVLIGLMMPVQATGGDPCTHTGYETSWGFNDEKHWQICQHCNGIIEGSEKVHEYFPRYLDNETHQMQCECGKTSGGAVPHSWNWQTDDSSHEGSCECDAFVEGPHTPGAEQHENVVASQPGVEGSYDAVYYCTVCGKELKREKCITPALPVEPEQEEIQQPDVTTYWITFKNDDGSLLGTIPVRAGVIPAFIGATKTETGYVSYSFAGWDPDPYPANKDEIYTAVFTENTKYYDITFVNADGTVLKKIQQTYGEFPSYSGETPVRKEDKYYTYEFIGWKPSISRVTGNMIYTAEYKQNFKYYHVQFTTERKPDDSIFYPAQKIRAGLRAENPGLLRDVRDSQEKYYHFLYWTDNRNIRAEEASAFDFENTEITEDLILEAVYARYEDEKPFMVTDIELCYIATYLYGSYDCPPVWVLRRFRDNVLSQTEGGRKLIRWYYDNCKGLVEQYGDNLLVCAAFQAILDTGVNVLMSLGFEDTEYRDATFTRNE